jgi:hypothetical protein
LINTAASSSPWRQGLQQLHSADIRHIDVEEDQVDLFTVEKLDRLKWFTKGSLELKVMWNL